MKYWWVNHKQTHDEEIGGGYVWSPKTNKGGRKNETYDNLPRTAPGDLVFSYAFASVKAIGRVTSPCRTADRPDFGKTGEQWDRDGWMVPIEWTLLSHPLSPKAHIQAIAPLLPERNSPLRETGDGVQNCYLAAISEQLGTRLCDLITAENPRQADLLELLKRQPSEDELEAAIKAAPEIPETEKQALVKSRRGQGLFRERVKAIEPQCRLTGLGHSEFLIASHIKPWRSSTNEERLDGANGLLLSPHADKLFDGGWISFQDNGDLLVAPGAPAEALTAWRIDAPAIRRAFSTQQCAYLAHHRAFVFRHTKALA
jgi:putative restriction endonuclease